MHNFIFATEKEVEDLSCIRSIIYMKMHEHLSKLTAAEIKAANEFDI